MGKRIAAVVVVCTLVGVVSWALHRPSPEGPQSSPETERLDRPSAPGQAATPDTGGPLLPRTVECAIHGVVVRRGVTVAARVEAFLLDAGPPSPCSDESWNSWEEEANLFKGAGTSVRGTSSSSADGRWRVGGLPPGRWLFQAVTEDGARGTAEATLRPAEPGAVPLPEGRELEIEVSPTPHSLRGRARLPGGAPFRGLVMAKEDWRLVGPPVETGPEGEFHLSSLPGACIRLVACEGGRRVVPGPFVLLPYEEEVPFVVGAGLVEITGRVLESTGDRGVAGARVTAGVTDGNSQTISDAEGRYSLFVPERDRLRLEARASGYLPAGASLQQGTTDFGPPIVLRLSKPARLSGTVRIDSTGAAAAGAVVVVLGGSGFPPIAGGRGTCGPDGRYEIQGLDPGRRVVLVAGGGFASRSLAGPEPWNPEANNVDLVEGVEAKRDLVVVTAPRVLGRVVDAEGTGVPGVSVTVSGIPAMQWSTDPGDAASEETFTTSSDGRFSVPSVLPGIAYEFLATRDGEKCAFAKLPPQEAGREAEVVLRIPPDCRVEVRVLEEETDRPLAGIGLSVMTGLLPDSGGRYWGLGRKWSTGDDGSVVVGPVPSAPFLLGARAGGDRGSGEPCQVRVEPPLSSPVVVHMKAPVSATGLVVEGTILLSDGSPAAGAEWRCTQDSLPGSFGLSGNADFKGRFRVSDLVAGRVSLFAWLPGNRNSLPTEAEAGDRQVVVRFKDAADFRIVVLDPNRKPVRGGKANFVFPDAEDDPPNSSRFVHADLVRGAAGVLVPRGSTKFWLQVEGALSADREPRLLADALFGPLDATAREFEAVLSPGTVIEGRVVDPDGGAVPGARVSVSADYASDPKSTGGLGFDCSAAAADATGRFRIEGVGNREYHLWAHAEGGFYGSVESKARGGDREVTVVMRKAATATITVLDPEGRPLPGAGVDLTTPGIHFGDRDIPITNAAGKVRLESLDPDGGDTLEVLPPEGRADLLQVTMEKWAPGDITVQLPSAHVLVVRVLDTKGQPLSSVSVIARFVGRETDPSACSYGTTAEDGTVSLKHIPAGPIAVSASLEGCSEGAGPTASAAVDGSRGRLTLTMDPGAEIRVRIPNLRANHRVSLTIGEPGHPSPRRQARCGAEVVRIRGLESGVAYDLYAEELPTDSSRLSVQSARRAALVRGVKPTDGVIEIPLAPGSDVSGVVRLPRDWGLINAGLLVGDAVLIGCDSSDYKGGTFHIGGVPEGRWTLRARLRSEDGQERTLDAETEAGGTVELDAR
jgi:hypothetical protein